MRHVMLTLAFVLTVAPAAWATSDPPFVLNWQVNLPTDLGGILTGSDPATLTPVSTPPPTIMVQPGARVFDLRFGNGFGGFVADPVWQGGPINLPGVGTTFENQMANGHFSLAADGSSFTVDVPFKSPGPDVRHPIIMGEFLGTGHQVTQAVEPATVGLTLTLLGGAAVLRRRRTNRGN